MRAQKVEANSDALLEPTSEIWEQVPGEKVDLKPAPVEYQVTKYIRNAWKDRRYGVIETAMLKALHNGEVVALRLEWADREHPDSEFPDSCAIAFPFSSSAPLETFGSKDDPLDLWFWRSDSPDQADEALARTMRDISSKEDSSLKVSARFLSDSDANGPSKAGQWAVVFQRPVEPRALGINLHPGKSVRFAVLVWEGANEERAGLAAMTPSWQQLEVEE